MARGNAYGSRGQGLRLGSPGRAVVDGGADGPFVPVGVRAGFVAPDTAPDSAVDEVVVEPPGEVVVDVADGEGLGGTRGRSSSARTTCRCRVTEVSPNPPIVT